MTELEPIFTLEELADFSADIEKHMPPFPVSEDGMHNPQVLSLTTAGGPAGLLLYLQTDKGLVKLYCNPVVAKQIVLNIVHANSQTPWWDGQGDFITKK
jgi:hypothetical protein